MQGYGATQNCMKLVGQQNDCPCAANSAIAMASRARIETCKWGCSLPVRHRAPRQ